MPRPRHDSEVLPAKERLENAFWELLADRDYRKITVTDVVREAGVNRNSFYYHFSSLPELADSAILHQVESIPINRTPDPNGNPEEQWRDRVTATLSDPEQRQRLDHLALLAGPHSTLELTESLRDFCRLQMLSTLQRDPKNLDLKTDHHGRVHRGRHARRAATLARIERHPSKSKTCLKKMMAVHGHGHIPGPHRLGNEKALLLC